MELEAGGKRYEEYYAAHPDRKASDDAARAAIPPRRACAASRACSGCERCADSCPAGAIARGAPGPGGFLPVDDDACFAAWKTLGTDCGLCIAACPLSRIRA